MTHAVCLNNVCLSDEESNKKIERIAIFGSVCWIHVPKQERNKFEDERAKLGMWVGIPEERGRAANKVYMIETREIILSRHLEIWDGVMLNQVINSKDLEEDELEKGNLTLIKFTPIGDRFVREFDSGIEQKKSVKTLNESREESRDSGVSTVPNKHKATFHNLLRTELILWVWGYFPMLLCCFHRTVWLPTCHMAEFILKEIEKPRSCASFDLYFARMSV